MNKLVFILYISIISPIAGISIFTGGPEKKYNNLSENYYRSNFTFNKIELSFSDTLKSCVDCHGDMLEGENVHAPAKSDCQRCHITNGQEHPMEAVAGFNLKADVPTLCYECHDPKNESKFVHDPVMKGNCLGCHDIHKSPNLYLVKANPVSGICYECHQLEIPKGNMIHGAITEGNCTGCHNPHEGKDQHFMKTSRLDRMCGSCHRPIRKQLKQEFTHTPFGKKKCFSCHNGHSAKNADLIDPKTRDLCLSCHEDIHQSIQTAGLTHQALNDDKACSNCHSGHGSAHRGNLVKAEKELCLTCHNNQIINEEYTIKGLKASLAKGNFVHQAITENGCTACHQPHVAELDGLLSAAFPNVSYAEAKIDNFELCFTCHDKRLFASASDTVTNFRNKDYNLHFAHIKGNKGRNCNLCHNVHGAKNKQLIDETVMFGSWAMPINYKPYENGGFCAPGCHEEKEYIRYELPDSLKIRN
jgi:predicted CXXCH cytochrome family protein